jgi:hypothetical protein
MTNSGVEQATHRTSPQFEGTFFTSLFAFDFNQMPVMTFGIEARHRRSNSDTKHPFLNISLRNTPSTQQSHAVGSVFDIVP